MVLHGTIHRFFDASMRLMLVEEALYLLQISSSIEVKDQYMITFACVSA